MTINIRSLNIACHGCLRVNVVYVSTYFRASVVYVLFGVPACQCAIRRANVLTWRANVPKRVSIFQTFLLQYAKGNFYTLLLYKKLYILLDLIVIHIICISIVHKSCIILHFYTSCHIKENCVEFFFYYFFSFLLFS